MQKIILVRHAKALDRSKAFAEHRSDKDRPLTPKGVREFKKHIHNHKKIFKNVELFVTSPYVRAIETLDIILEALALSGAAIKIIAKITPEDKFTFLKKWLLSRKEKTIVVVSHEPFLSNFLHNVLQSHKPLKIKKAALIILSCESNTKKYKLISLKNPK